MGSEETTKQQIYQLIEDLPDEQLSDLLRFLEGLLKNTEATPATGIAPIYQIHREAISTGVPDLAEHHDCYLYSTRRNDA